MGVTAIMWMVVTATGTVTAMASDDPRATAALVVLAAATVAVDTALAVDITVAKVDMVDMAVIMVARVARVAKEGIIEEETMVAASPPTTVEVVLVPSTLTPIRTAVIMAVVAVVTATARRTDVVAAVAEIVEERILIMVTDRLTAVVAWEGIITLFKFLSLFRHVFNESSKAKFIRHVPRTTYKEDPTPIHIKKSDTDEYIGRKVK